MAEHLTKALMIALGLAAALFHVWFWTTHGFYCPDGSLARQVGKWPLHEMSCQHQGGGRG